MNEDVERHDHPTISWEDFDAKTLLDRSFLSEVKLQDSHKNVKQADHYDIPDFEEEALDLAVCEKYLDFLVCDKNETIRDFYSKLSTPVVMKQRITVSENVLNKISSKYHEINVGASFVNANCQENAVATPMVNASTVLWEMSVKTLMSFLFSLLRVSEMSADTRMNLLSEDVLSSCSNMLMAVPALALSNESHIPDIAINCLDEVSNFVCDMIKDQDVKNSSLKRSCCEILLSLGFLRGKEACLFNWIQTCLEIGNEKITLSTAKFKHWLEFLAAEDDDVDPSREEELDITLAALILLKKLSTKAVLFTRTLSLTSGCSSQQEIYVWGNSNCIQLPGCGNVLSPKKIESFNDAVYIEAGQNCTFVVFNDGSLKTCGEGLYGQLDSGDSTNHGELQQVDICNVCQVASSKDSDGHSLALTRDGCVYSWGNGNFGKLGHGDITTQKTPKLIQGPLHNKVISTIAVAHCHSAAITKDGELYTWGEGEHGRLGHGDSTSKMFPTLVQNIGVVSQVATGNFHTVVLSKDGCTLWTFGAAENGKLGHGNNREEFYPKVVDALKGTYIKKIAAGTQCSMALAVSGLVYAWGSGPCLGNGEVDIKHCLPKIIESLQSKQIIDISLGDSHCLALTEENEVYCWGSNSVGQCGLGHCITPVSWPTHVSGFAGVTIEQISAGSTHSVVWIAPSTKRNVISTEKPCCISIDQETFDALHSLLQYYFNKAETLAPYSDRNVPLKPIVDLLTSHITLASANETFIMSDNREFLLKLLLQLFDVEQLRNEEMLDDVQRTLLLGAHCLLPDLDEQIQLLLKMLPQDLSSYNSIKRSELMFLKMVLQNIADHTIIAKLVGSQRLLKDDLVENEVKRQALGMMLPHLLRSTMNLMLEKQDKQDQVLSDLLDDMLRVQQMLQTHLLASFKHHLKVGMSTKIFEDVLLEYFDVYSHLVVETLNSASEKLADLENQPLQVLDCLMDLLAGPTLFSLVHYLLCLPSWVVTLDSLMDVFTALNRVNLLSPACTEADLQEIGSLLELDSQPKELTDCAQVWLYDMQHVFAVLIGRSIHDSLSDRVLLKEEVLCSKLLNSALLRNGLEEREEIRDHAMEDCLKQLKVCTLHEFEWCIATAIPEQTLFLLNMANVASMNPTWQCFLHHISNGGNTLNFNEQPEFVCACVGLCCSTIIHHCSLTDYVMNETWSLNIMSAVFDVTISLIQKFLFHEAAKNQDELTQRCLLFFQTCIVLTLAVRPMLEDDITSVVSIQWVGDELASVIEETMAEGNDDLNENLKSIQRKHLQQAKRRLQSLKLLHKILEDDIFKHVESCVVSCRIHLLMSAFGKTYKCSSPINVASDISLSSAMMQSDILSCYEKVLCIVLDTTHAKFDDIVSSDAISKEAESLKMSAKEVTTANRPTNYKRDAVIYFKNLLQFLLFTEVDSTTQRLHSNVSKTLFTNFPTVTQFQSKFIAQFTKAFAILVCLKDNIKNDRVLRVVMHQLLVDLQKCVCKKSTMWRRTADIVVLLKRCCLMSADACSILQENKWVDFLMKILSDAFKSFELRLIVVKLLKVVFKGSCTEIDFPRPYEFIKQLFEFLHSLVWVEPFSTGNLMTFTHGKNVLVCGKRLVHTGTESGCIIIDVPLTDNIYLWKCLIESSNESGDISLGVCSLCEHDTSDTKWLYRGYDGSSFHNGTRVFGKFPTFSVGDSVTLVMDGVKQILYATKNEGDFFVLYSGLEAVNLYPCIVFGDSEGKEEVKVNELRIVSKHSGSIVAPPVITLCEEIACLLTILHQHTTFAPVIRNFVRDCYENLTTENVFSSITNLCSCLFPLLTVNVGLDRSLLFGRKCLISNGGTGLVVDLSQKQAIIQHGEPNKTCEIDAKKLQSVPEELPEFSTLGLSVVECLKVYCETRDILTKHQDVSPLINTSKADVLKAFLSSRRSTTLNFLNLKSLQKLIESNQFILFLIKYKKNSEKDDFALFTSLLKSICNTCQQHGTLKHSSSMQDYERAVNMLSCFTPQINLQQVNSPKPLRATSRSLRRSRRFPNNAFAQLNRHELPNDFGVPFYPEQLLSLGSEPDVAHNDVNHNSQGEASSLGSRNEEQRSHSSKVPFGPSNRLITCAVCQLNTTTFSEHMSSKHLGCEQTINDKCFKYEVHNGKETEELFRGVCGQLSSSCFLLCKECHATELSKIPVFTKEEIQRAPDLLVHADEREIRKNAVDFS